ncbi:hypothetical protein H7J77_14040 [Mycolicibacillus parakoreensis]|uniref:CopG family transcriptional regulator n=1 Tax=Mycolicibacillus parakoreensis TaxID=1069221 RepID=A0ABY3TYV0_9MYCO|nr:hypothetical protein [Mycolicibacillus parakoreensis]MCV7316655.1 hypothetical protein [Mycolicibacillus parakoreensis]ULN52865.1 hypothetical protein MIU77_00220 [Mycolicibacillus parakoreensis]
MTRRPTMGHRDRVRVEFGLAPETAERVYEYAKGRGLSLSAAGTLLLNQALNHNETNGTDDGSLP